MRQEEGFTLVELATVLAIVSVLILGSLSIMRPLLVSAKRVATEQRMEVIVDAISTYVHTYGRLPCPAIPDTTPSAADPPFGYQKGSGTSGTNTNISCVGSDVEGIVPFQSLGLGVEEIRDGWGRYFSYRISPAFALDTVTYPNATIQTHAACRFMGWSINKRGVIYNRNITKARFCCPPAGNSGNVYHPSKDVSIIDAATGKPLWAGIRTDNVAFYDVESGAITIELMNNVLNPEASQVETIAFALVSHGANGYGAFTGITASARRADFDSLKGTDEDENIDGDNVFIYRALTSQDNNSYFDDMITWRTQNQIYSELGGDSCLKP